MSAQSRSTGEASADHIPPSVPASTRTDCPAIAPPRIDAGSRVRGRCAKLQRALHRSRRGGHSRPSTRPTSKDVVAKDPNFASGRSSFSIYGQMIATFRPRRIGLAPKAARLASSFRRAHRAAARAVRAARVSPTRAEQSHSSASKARCRRHRRLDLPRRVVLASGNRGHMTHCFRSMPI
jgi:hypothetical protein